ncbi:MAG: glycosyltransferase family 87 protein [Anaerolineales bacterium]
MQSINLRRVFLLSSLLALTLIYSVLWAQMIVDSFERTGTDFMALYAAGKIAREHGFSQVYDLQLQKQVEESVLGFQILPTDVNPFVHPPFILPVLAVISNWDYPTAFSIWGFFLLLIFVLSSWILSKSLVHIGKPVILFLGSLLFFPTFVSILNGQNTAILALGGALWLYGFTKRDDRLSGIGLALTTIRPHFAILLAAPFLFKRRKIFWWFCAGAGFLTLFSIVLVKISGTLAFIDILTVSASGEGYKINESAMFNVIGWLHRTLPAFSPANIRLTGWIIYAIAFIGLILFWIRSKTLNEGHVGIAVLTCLLAVPHLHYHDLALLLVPIFCLLIMADRRLRSGDAALIPLALSTLLLVGHIPFLRYYTPYILMFGLGIVLWYFGKIKNADPSFKPK